MAYLVW